MVASMPAVATCPSQSLAKSYSALGVAARSREPLFDVGVDVLETFLLLFGIVRVRTNCIGAVYSSLRTACTGMDIVHLFAHLVTLSGNLL